MIENSELILNQDGSIYHLMLLPGEVAPIIITVGDPFRVDRITKYFDSVEVEKQNREFKTVTGTFNGTRLSVVATGIGTDNIDIVFNELDALFNIDFETREIKSDLKTLDFIRIGTSGSINPKVAVDSVVISEYAIGLDGLINYYQSDNVREQGLEVIVNQSTSLKHAYAVAADQILVNRFAPLGKKGITITANGFYGPQSRRLRLAEKTNIINEVKDLSYNSLRCTNLEMETAGIYGLAKLLGHRAVSLNAILASRINGTFSSNADSAIDNLIQQTLKIISPAH